MFDEKYIKYKKKVPAIMVRPEDIPKLNKIILGIIN